MAGIELNRKALATLRETVNTQAGKLASIGDRFPGKAPAGASIFGGYTAAGGLSAAAGRLEQHADQDFGLAKNRLDGVERALDVIERNVRRAEHGTEAGLPAV
ncbi:hypothetical protein [Sphaerisporangium sp. TRM90804]|uniref:hypothetical protein n=1 Tax=Sphaerisporangium sp. TRM90804 TaxID=3031113 RepID=UPI00244B0CEB|nr:hypothetical protein [Sphaerisporangium sp. TRM90804]MDH2425077.1 hypothetical protein [Sphaerisporangium sp. TRM90804]